MQLTDENYYSQEANREYMSVSQFKDFSGTYGKLACEYSAKEKLEGRWEDEKTSSSAFTEIESGGTYSPPPAESSLGKYFKG